MFAYAKQEKKQVAKSTVQKKEEKTTSLKNMKNHCENPYSFSFVRTQRYKSSDKPIQNQGKQIKVNEGTIQRNVSNAKAYKEDADKILKSYFPYEKTPPTTVAMSDCNFAVCPSNQATYNNSKFDISRKCNKEIAEGGDHEHAEVKLIKKEPNMSDMGVSNVICKGCFGEINKKIGSLEHVAEPRGVSEITSSEPLIWSKARRYVLPYFEINHFAGKNLEEIEKDIENKVVETSNPTLLNDTKAALVKYWIDFIKTLF